MKKTVEAKFRKNYAMGCDDDDVLCCKKTSLLRREGRTSNNKSNLK